MGKIREWPVSISNLPCACEHCYSDPDNTVCVYAPWRKTRREVMKEAIPLPSDCPLANVEQDSNISNDEEIVSEINA